MKRFLLPLFFVLTLPFAGTAQLITLDTVVTQFNSYQKKHPQEKVYIRTDKETYTLGSTIWFSAYVVDALAHLPSALSKLLYVELIDANDKVIAQREIKVEGGIGKGDFMLTEELTEGLYHLRAYTNYMKNFPKELLFTRPIKILALSDRSEATPEEVVEKFEVQFFPEGGELVAGLLNQVAFKAINQEGKGVKITGKIIDKKEQEIVDFEEKILGMGAFLFTPKKGQQYFARYTYNGKTYKTELPKVQDTGYTLNVRQTKSKVTVTAKASEGLDLSKTFVIGHIRGKIFMMAKGDPRQAFIRTKIPSTQIPSGVLHFTLFDEQGRPRCERLSYNDNKTENPVLELAADTLFANRKKASFQLNLKDVEGQAVNGNISVAVLSKKYNGANKVDIENYLLMSADLHGDIERPDVFFDKSNPQRFQHRNLLMMINGWSRFTWNDVIEGKLQAINHYPEQGFSIEGKVVKYSNQKKGVESNVSIRFMENMLFEEDLDSEVDGDFWFDGLQIEDTLTVVLKSKRLKNGKDGQKVFAKGNTAIQLKEKTPPPIDYQFSNLFGEKVDYDAILDQSIKIINIEGQYDTKLITLDEVTVKASKKKKNRPFHRESMLYNNPDKRVIMDSIGLAITYQSIFDVLRSQVPGVRVGGLPPNYKAFIRNQEASFLLNGVPMADDFIQNVNPDAVEFLDVIRGSRAAVYGTGGPVIAVYLREGVRNIRNETPTSKNFLAFTLNGYYQSREFYVPDYTSMSEKEKLKPDYRSTLYWNPSVIIEGGQANIDFFTSDEKGIYHLYIEGLSEAGKPIKQDFQFTVK